MMRSTVDCCIDNSIVADSEQIMSVMYRLVYLGASVAQRLGQ